MSNFITVGNVAVSREDLKNLSGEDKISILDSMFNGCGMETDEHGQIIQYTELMFKEEQHEGEMKTTVVPLSVNPNDVEDISDEPDPYEEEEEPISSENFPAKPKDAYGDEELPPTIRGDALPETVRLPHVQT